MSTILDVTVKSTEFAVEHGEGRLSNQTEGLFAGCWNERNNQP